MAVTEARCGEYGGSGGYGDVAGCVGMVVVATERVASMAEARR